MDAVKNSETIELDWGEAEERAVSDRRLPASPLSLEAAKQPLTPTEAASVRGLNTDITLRPWMCLVMALVFVGLNLGVGWMVYVAYVADLDLLRQKLETADQRVISEKVFIALIGGTVVQVGAGIAAIVAYLFPKRGV
jgi:hypothetical protein